MLINFLGYLYYRNGDSKKTFEKYLDIYSQGYNSLEMANSICMKKTMMRQKNIMKWF